MTRNELSTLLRELPRARIAVLGDFCLDVYWELDFSASELSLETGLATWPAAAQRYYPGAAGTVARDLVVLGRGRVSAFGIVGVDPWGGELARVAAGAGIDNANLLPQKGEWATLAYLKPYRDGQELNRIDFGNFNRLDDRVADELLSKLEAELPELDAVVINQQIKTGVHSAYLRPRLRALIGRYPATLFIADSRDFPDYYENACLKINDHEATRLLGRPQPPEVPVPPADAEAATAALHRRTGKEVFVTRGAAGCLVCDHSGLHALPAVPVTGPLDPVGAGDCFLSGVALALAVRHDAVSAATLGNLAAAVSVKKLHETGSASPDEIMAMAENCPLLA